MLNASLFTYFFFDIHYLFKINVKEQLKALNIYSAQRVLKESVIVEIYDKTVAIGYFLL